MQPDLDLYQALCARDTRFDGRFYVGVKTTGIYCRPVCPARTPRARSCVFLDTAAAAEQAGFRPCMRCRPELAPAVPGISLEQALFAAIRARFAHGESVDRLAVHAGFSARQLRRIIRRAFGVTPVEIMQTERLLFAKKLLQETTLPVSEVALSAGFGSLRRFNALFQSRYRQAPTTLRRGRAATNRAFGATSPDTLVLRLVYRPPLAWDVMLDYLSWRVVPGVEMISAVPGSYARTVRFGPRTGWLMVRRPRGVEHLEVTFPASLADVSWSILSRLRAQFDLDANPAYIDAHLRLDPLLAPGVGRHPGLRVPGAWDPFELAVRAVLGQQISVAGASTLAAKLAAKFGRPVDTPIGKLSRLAPAATDLAAAAVDEIAAVGMPRTRAQTLRDLAVSTAQGELEFGPAATVETVAATLRQIKGIGEWTAQYVAMRALRFPDAFPAGDLGLRKAIAAPGAPLPSERELLARAAGWSPWRAYAALHLWQSLHDSALPSKPI